MDTVTAPARTRPGDRQVTGTSAVAGASQGDSDSWKGLSSLTEELAATGQAISEMTAGGHREAIGRERLHARLGALRAAIDFAIASNALDWNAVNRQRDQQR